MALSSPRLVIPAALYGIWILSQHILPNFEFQVIDWMLKKPLLFFIVFYGLYSVLPVGCLNSGIAITKTISGHSV